MWEEEAPTPPPSPRFGTVVDNLPLSDVVRKGGLWVGRREASDMVKMKQRVIKGRKNKLLICYCC
jgi:hypothetical protein